MMRRIVFGLVGLLCVGAASSAHADREVKLEEVPAAVRATITREAKGATIQEIEEDLEDGKKVYEVELTKDGERWELDIANDGTLLERHRD